MYIILILIVIIMTCCKKSIGLLIIRLWFWAFFLMWGITKLMHPEMADMVWGAAHALGLTFLPTTVWFWLAATWETLTGLLFILGIFLPLGAVLAIIIMLVALFWAHKGDMQQWMAAITFLIASLGLGFTWPGKYSLKSLCCKKCSTNNCTTNNTPKTPEIVNA